MAKQKTINREFKTVFFDYDGTMFDTAGADQYVARQKTLRRFSPEWVQARKEYLEHIKQCPLSSWMRLLTSRMLGMFSMVTGSHVSNVAQITCRASFLAPCGVMVPCSG